MPPVEEARRNDSTSFRQGGTILQGVGGDRIEKVDHPPDPIRTSAPMGGDAKVPVRIRMRPATSRHELRTRGGMKVASTGVYPSCLNIGTDETTTPRSSFPSVRYNNRRKVAPGSRLFNCERGSRREHFPHGPAWRFSRNVENWGQPVQGRNLRRLLPSTNSEKRSTAVDIPSQRESIRATVSKLRHIRRAVGFHKSDEASRKRTQSPGSSRVLLHGRFLWSGSARKRDFTCYARGYVKAGSRNQNSLRKTGSFTPSSEKRLSMSHRARHSRYIGRHEARNVSTQSHKVGQGGVSGQKTSRICAKSPTFYSRFGYSEICRARKFCKSRSSGRSV